MLTCWIPLPGRNIRHPYFSRSRKTKFLVPAAVLSFLHRMEKNVICFIMPARFPTTLRAQWTHVLPAYKKWSGTKTECLYWEYRKKKENPWQNHPVPQPIETSYILYFQVQDMNVLILPYQ